MKYCRTLELFTEPPVLLPMCRRFLTILLVAVLHSAAAAASDAKAVIEASSPPHRIALLELYTSQGCSSCPPAERWLSSLKHAEISSQQIIPLAFHVTYWDYIGWQDRYGSARYDQRQRRVAAYNAQRTIYTPQFVLAGDDYRSHSRFADDVKQLVSQAASLDLAIRVVQQDNDKAEVVLTANSRNNDVDQVALFIAIYENNLQDEVDAGENEGERLLHDYVVRQLNGPYHHTLSDAGVSIRTSFDVESHWKRADLNIVAFAQHAQTGEVLQALHAELKNLK